MRPHKLTTYKDPVLDKQIETIIASLNKLDAAQATIGQVVTGNYAEFEQDGTLVFKGDATVVNDLQFSISSGKVGAANAPAWAAFVGNLFEYTFAVNDYMDLGAQEIPHSYKSGTDIFLHVHWASNGSNVDNRFVKWEIEYAIAGGEGITLGDVFTGTTVASNESVIPANTLSKTNMFTQIAVISGTNIVFGAMLKLRLKRIAATGSAPSSNPFALQVGAHFYSDTIGSRQVASK